MNSLYLSHSILPLIPLDDTTTTTTIQQPIVKKSPTTTATAASINTYVNDLPTLQGSTYFTQDKKGKLQSLFASGEDPTQAPFFSVEKMNFTNNTHLRAMFSIDMH